MSWGTCTDWVRASPWAVDRRPRHAAAPVVAHRPCRADSAPARPAAPASSRPWPAGSTAPGGAPRGWQRGTLAVRPDAHRSRAPALVVSRRAWPDGTARSSLLRRWMRQGRGCSDCPSPATTVDHVVPLLRGRTRDQAHRSATPSPAVPGRQDSGNRGRLQRRRRDGRGMPHVEHRPPKNQGDTPNHPRMKPNPHTADARHVPGAAEGRYQTTAPCWLLARRSSSQPLPALGGHRRDRCVDGAFVGRRAAGIERGRRAQCAAGSAAPLGATSWAPHGSRPPRPVMTTGAPAVAQPRRRHRPRRQEMPGRSGAARSSMPPCRCRDRAAAPSTVTATAGRLPSPLSRNADRRRQRSDAVTRCACGHLRAAHVAPDGDCRACPPSQPCEGFDPEPASEES